MQNADYEMLILEILYERGGRAERSDVLGSIGKKLEGRLRPGDHEGTLGRPDYPTREHRVDGARQWLREHSYLKTGSPRGVWELTDRGHVHAERAKQ